MTIERPMFPPRAESVDSFSPQPAIGQPESQTLTGESRKAAKGLSRRAALAGFAMLPAAVPALAAVAGIPTPDPVFALIEAKQAADVAHLNSCNVLNEAERRYGVGSDEAEAAFIDGGPACHAAYEAACLLASTPPTTLAGILAVLRFVNEIEDRGDWPEDQGLERQRLVTTAQAIETIICQAAGGLA